MRDSFLYYIVVYFFKRAYPIKTVAANSAPEILAITSYKSAPRVAVNSS